MDRIAGGLLLDRGRAETGEVRVPWAGGRCTGDAPQYFAGDTLYAESTVLSKRESKSRPTQGIVTVSTRGLNQDGKEVMSFERTMLIYKRGHSPEAEANY